MTSIQLLPRPRRAWLISFGCAVASLLLLLAGLLSLHEGSTSIVVLGTCVALGSAITAYLWPHAWELPYRVWNKLARHYGQFVRLYLLGLCYMIVSLIRLAGRASSFSRDSVAGSGWIARPTKSVPTYDVLRCIEETRAKRHGWIRSYVSWATTSRQLWVLMLLPFLIGLSLLEVDDDKTILSTTYTLF